jgi:hypothetical protein
MVESKVKFKVKSQITKDTFENILKDRWRAADESCPSAGSSDRELITLQSECDAL